MVKTTLEIEGMACGMCESHINEAIRRAAKVKKVTSSHRKGQTVVVTQDDVDEGVLRAAVEKTGYRVLSVSRQEC